MRRAMRTAALASAWVTFGVPLAPAHAEPAAQAPRAPNDAALPAPTPSGDGSRLQLGLGAGLIVGLGDAQVGRGDAIGIEGPLVFMQLSLAPAYRVSPALAVGLRASYGSDLGSRSQVSSSGESLSLGRSLWEAAATLRYQAEPGRGGYVGVNAGAAALVDSEGDVSVAQWAFPALGVAVGYDFELARRFAFGVEARAAYADFSGEGARLERASGESSYYAYDTSAWLGLAVVGTVLQ
jgi:hypothetical protein